MGASLLFLPTVFFTMGVEAPMGACLLFLAAVFSTMGVEAPAFVLELLFFTIRTEHADEWGVLSGALESLGPQTETVSVHGWAEKLRRAAQVRCNCPCFAKRYPPDLRDSGPD